MSNTTLSDIEQVDVLKLLHLVRAVASYVFASDDDDEVYVGDQDAGGLLLLDHLGLVRLEADGRWLLNDAGEKQLAGLLKIIELLNPGSSRETFGKRRTEPTHGEKPH